MNAPVDSVLPAPDPRPRDARAGRGSRSRRFGPVAISVRKSRWGRQRSSGSPSSARRRFRSSAGAWRTAYTPAFGVGPSASVPMSPTANAKGCETLRRCASIDTKPRASVANPAFAGQSGPVAPVHQTSSSRIERAPVGGDEHSGPRRRRASTSKPACTATPAARASSRAMRPTRSGRPAERPLEPRSTQCSVQPVARQRVAHRHERSRSRRRRSRRRRPRAGRPGTSPRSSRAASACQRAAKPCTGLTGTECSRAPGTDRSGVEPVSSDSQSNSAGGRSPSKRIVLASRSRPLMRASTKRTPAHVQSLRRSTWISSAV